MFKEDKTKISGQFVLCWFDFGPANASGGSLFKQCSCKFVCAFACVSKKPDLNKHTNNLCMLPIFSRCAVSFSAWNSGA